MADDLMEEQQNSEGEAADLAGTMTAIIAAAGEGGRDLAGRGRPSGAARRIFLRAVEVRDFERRLQLLENQPTPSY